MAQSRDKGKRGELEFAHLLTEAGFPARRGQQFSGGSDSPDVVCESLSNVHWEVKRTESVRLQEWIEQAVRDAGEKLPVIVHRKNGMDWVAIVPIQQFLKFINDTTWCL